MNCEVLEFGCKGLLVLVMLVCVAIPAGVAFTGSWGGRPPKRK